MSKIIGLLDYVRSILLTGIAYPLGRLLYRNKGIWLIGERSHQAQDNGLHFFRYMKESHPDRRCYYVIKKDSHQLDKVAEIGDVIYFGSWKHWLIYFGCEAVISAHIRGILPSRNWRYKQLASHHKQKNKKIVFLQHGVTKDNIPGLYRERAHADLFICGAKPEYEYVRDNFHYHKDEVKYTGFARFDALHDIHVKKQILIMPTWRDWLVKRGVDLENSEYVSEWNKVISDSAVIQAAKREGYQIIFYLHSRMQFARDLFRSVDDSVVIAKDTDYDVQTLLKESALLITDYSSVYFDFAYMRKPVFYYQFDKEQFVSDHYQKGYFDYERDGFGKVAYSASELTGNVINILSEGVALNAEYHQRIDRFFPYYDRKNCERIYREIVKLV